MIDFNIKLKLSIDTDTGEYKITLDGVDYSGNASKKVSSKSSTTKTKKESPENINNPGLIREDGKLILSDELIESLNASPGDKISINYDKVGTRFIPFIMIDEKKGNKLTEKLTVSYRGKSNIELSRYGTNFKFEEGKISGSFYLIGDVEQTEIESNDEIVIDDDFELNLNLDDTQVNQITTFNFSDIDLD